MKQTTHWNFTPKMDPHILIFPLVLTQESGEVFLAEQHLGGVIAPPYF